MLLTALIGCNNPSNTVDNGCNSNITDNMTNYIFEHRRYRQKESNRKGCS